jgi:hypothetical protein
MRRLKLTRKKAGDYSAARGIQLANALASQQVPGLSTSTSPSLRLTSMPLSHKYNSGLRACWHFPIFSAPLRHDVRFSNR